MSDVLALINEALVLRARDYDSTLAKVDRYLRGDFDAPYSPKKLSVDHKEMMRRAQQNWVVIPVNASAQALAVDGLRLGEDADQSAALVQMPEWGMWQRSNLDAKQDAVHRGAIGYGQAFVLSERGEDGLAYARVLSSLNTAMLFEDPSADDNALVAVTVVRHRSTVNGKPRDGLAYAWDRFNRYTLSLGETVGVVEVVDHGGNGHCPVTRFCPQIDTEGRVVGAVKPIIHWQDTFNQMMFNLLVAQSQGAHRILYASGLQLPEMRDDEGRPVLDEFGNPRPVPVEAGPGDMLVSTSADTKFGALNASDLGGYISSLDMLVKDFLALTQTPPDFLLGQMANLSAEALATAERSFRRKINGYQRQFGEAWERVLRIGMIIEGRQERPDWEHNEVLWRDFEQHQLVGVADALAKLKDIGVPPRGLWEMIPGVSPRQLDQWAEYAEQLNQLDHFGRQLEEYAALPDPLNDLDDGDVVVAGGGSAG